MPSKTIHVANGSDQDIYVLAIYNFDYAIPEPGDLSDERSFLGDAGLPKPVAEAKELYKCLKDGAAMRAGVLPSDQSVLDKINVMKEKADRISRGAFEAVYRQDLGFGDRESTINLLTMSEDGKQVAFWESPGDDAWIATKDGKIVRSVHGELWNRNPNAGNQDVDWSVPKADYRRLVN